ncbi:uncharacterized protein C8Q71DRAFT_156503 [Rhodofomes roseus]|uniref:Uncharacterized protein n=1 Tax=Rhodofomes roseus TaxID=34475 RepID=A0ABQ8K9H6_9APHY|nr:uncharacterized protein C8Q71DRAFT_156503 [Rhodofomes roseus]KAH9834018.1 hypothetical protein C8Q71DRAFT_156503 [Rhodofomes roseus]
MLRSIIFLTAPLIQLMGTERALTNGDNRMISNVSAPSARRQAVNMNPVQTLDQMRLGTGNERCTHGGSCNRKQRCFLHMRSIGGAG